jgi:hypothetical protein
METSPDLEFDYMLAEKLSMTVAEMRRRVSNAERLGWYVYLGRKEQHRQMAQLGG